MSSQPPLENRVKNVEEAVQILTSLIIKSEKSNTDARMANEAWSSKSREAQAQIKTDLAALRQIISNLGRAQRRSDES